MGIEGRAPSNENDRDFGTFALEIVLGHLSLFRLLEALVQVLHRALDFIISVFRNSTILFCKWKLLRNATF